ncbi:MAG: hypothetical protein AAB353_05840, partial [Candidatus Hydrogenedentota bacterium]
SIGQPLISNAGHDAKESLRVCQLSEVEPKSLLIEVLEKLVWFYAHVGTADPAFQERLGILKAIRILLALPAAEGTSYWRATFAAGC